jgi:RND family efflux transporter MFP subunit
MPVRLLAAILLAMLGLSSDLALAPTPALAHGGEDHSHGEASAPPPAPPLAQPGFGAEGGAFQAVLAPVGEGGVRLYLADADSNAPITGAAVEAEAQGKSLPVTAETEGVYRLDWTPPAQGADVTLTISAAGRDDLLLIQAVRPPSPPQAPPPSYIAHWTHWVGGGLIGLGLAAAWLVMGRIRKGAGLALLLALATSPALAQQSVVMDKAAQFLLGIRTERIEPREAADTTRVVGRVIPDPGFYARIQPSQQARVLAEPGFEIPVPGQVVKKGQVLAVLEPTLTNLERGDKRSNLTRIESQLAIAEADLARQTALGALVPVKQVETTRIQVDQLRRERGQIAGTQLGRELVTAPLDGVITDVHLVPGEVVSPSQSLVEVVDPAHLRIEAIIHDLTLARRVAGAVATSALLPGRAIRLELLGKSPKLDPQDQGIHAVFRVDPAQAAELSLGLPLDVYLETGAVRLRTAVPRDAVTEMGGRPVVLVRTAPELFEIRPIKVEKVIGPLAEISGPIAAGERVVVQGIEQLRAGR